MRSLTAIIAFLLAGTNPANLARVRNRGPKGYSGSGERHTIAAATLAQMPNCPQCGAELDSSGPAGLCPECLIQGAFDSSVGARLRNSDHRYAGGAAGDDDFGRYHILRPLGEGGMGTVYLAEQREPIRRCVALKVIKLGMDTGQVLARFANERQALAMMDHPNIARIIDAGATPKGRPYFVMEYIEGVPITQYCDGKRMTIGATAGTVPRRVPCGSARASERCDPSRPQTVECAGDGTGGHTRSESDRFRHRQGHRPMGRGEHAAHAIRPDGGHTGVRQS